MISRPQNNKRYDLEERTLRFSKSAINLVKTLPKNSINNRLSDQFIRSGTSMGANYCEANETETKKDFSFRMRICRKEGKETIYWLNLILENNLSFENNIQPLVQETMELVKIFAAIINKSR